MDSSAYEWIAGLFAFLIGSVPFGLLVARLSKVKDLRAQGSGNIGATNVTRIAGWKAGLATFVLDVWKGALPVLLTLPGIATPFGQSLGIENLAFEPSAPWIVGLCAVLGHCFSPWLRFRGGKGVATGFGALLVLSPWAALSGITGFILVFATRKIGSLASLSGLIAASAMHVALFSWQPHFVWGAVLVAVIIFRHETNIDALLKGSENSFG